MRVVFFGTPSFAVPSLTALIDAGFVIPRVVTQPDRPVGRSGQPRPSPVADVAREKGTPVEKPERLRGNERLLQRLADARCDAIAVVAYGKLLPGDILDLPPFGCVNVHASLLPRHRGASPIAAAILAGDRETGVVTMKVVPELDAGPVYLARSVPIGEREDAETLSGRLARQGAGLLVETLRALESGTVEPRAQAGEPTYSRPIRREDARVDWNEPAAAIERRRRAFTPWPGLHAFLDGERVKLLDLEVDRGAAGTRDPATVWLEGNDAKVAAGGGTVLTLVRVQREGRKPVSGAEFLRGLPTLPARFESG
ncbi:MAG TPA: methionyl-tRNA formyltransferase [Thermoanaerobaculia bacterium]|jgi:methionyl-tRNA formyltransferase